MGTSLTVHPFASLIQLPHKNVPRILINRDKVGMVSFIGFPFNGMILHYISQCTTALTLAISRKNISEISGSREIAMSVF